jgi:hypothetical protein
MMTLLSWIDSKNGERFQPATVLWENTQTWTLPFGNPVSYWHTLVYSKLPNGVFGTDLSKKYIIYYPETMILPDKFPPLVHSYFAQDFDFVVLPKDIDKRKLPYSDINKGAPDVEILQAAEKEVLDNLQWIRDHSDNQPHGQQHYNNKESIPSQWCKLFPMRYDKIFVDRDRLPKVWSLIDSLGLQQIRGIYIGIIPPGSYIAPHIDDHPNDPVKAEIYKNSYLLYLPLSWQSGNYFKFSGAGILTDPKFISICNRDYVHSVVNASTDTRVAMSFWVDCQANPDLELYHCS